jgi:hypothetical protein
MKNPTLQHVLELRFKTSGKDASSLEYHLRRVQQMLHLLAMPDPLLTDTEWLVATGERDSSYLYPVFDATGPTKAALAVLTQSTSRSDVVKSFSLWNGQEEKVKGASLSCIYGRKDGVASSVELSVKAPRGESRFGTWEQAAATLGAACRIFEPVYGSLSTMYYDGVFRDRPGVGWMLYLPRLLTVQQVPEARALVPVKVKDDKGKEAQLGTIVVSTDEPFTEETPEHVKAAHSIEIRLVDQDLVPRYTDL